MNQTARISSNVRVLEPDRYNESENVAKKRRSFKLSRSKMPLLVVMLLLIYLAVIFSSQFSSIASIKREVTGISQEITEMKQRNEFLRNEIRNIRSDAQIEKAAREQLGLVKAGETRVIVQPVAE